MLMHLCESTIFLADLVNRPMQRIQLQIDIVIVGGVGINIKCVLHS